MSRNPARPRLSSAARLLLRQMAAYASRRRDDAPHLANPSALLDAAIAHACAASRKPGVCPGLLVEELDQIEAAVRGAFLGQSVTVLDVARMLAELGGER